MHNQKDNSNFPVILLLIVLILTVIISAFLILFNQQDPNMQQASVQNTVTEEAEEEEEETDAPPEAVNETASADASSLRSDNSAGTAASVTSARSSTATTPVGVRPRYLPVDGELPEEEGSLDATEEVTLIDREALQAEREAREREARATSHLVSPSLNAPEPPVSNEDIWAQFQSSGQDVRFDAAYDVVEQEANALVDAVYVEMTRLYGGSGNEEILYENLADLESIDVTSFAQSEKLVVRRSAYFLDWQNVTVAQYAEDFIDAFEEGDRVAMSNAILNTRNVYSQMTSETDYRYQLINSY